MPMMRVISGHLLKTAIISTATTDPCAKLLSMNGHGNMPRNDLLSFTIHLIWKRR